MANTGWWGDKVIISLSSNDKPRHKKWCVHYRKSDNHCCEQNLKCNGSSHCVYYSEMSTCGPTVITDNVVVPEDVSIVEEVDKNKSPNLKGLSAAFLGRHPCLSEKMLGKIVAVRVNLSLITLGDVIAEDNESFTIEKDNGVTSKYSRKVVLKAKSVWIIDNYDEYISKK